MCTENSIMRTGQVWRLALGALLCLSSVQCGDSDTADNGAVEDSESGSREDASSGASCAEASSQEECESLDGCVSLMARRADLERGCYEREESYTGCMSVETGCGGAMTHAIHPETGECWLFWSTCIPDGWSEAEPGGDPSCVPMGSVEVCAD